MKMETRETITEQEKNQFGREMKIITGEDLREIKIKGCSDLWEYLDSLAMCASYMDVGAEDILVLQSPLGRIERNLIVGWNFNEIACV